MVLLQFAPTHRMGSTCRARRMQPAPTHMSCGARRAQVHSAQCVCTHPHECLVCPHQRLGLALVHCPGRTPLGQLRGPRQLQHDLRIAAAQQEATAYANLVQRDNTAAAQQEATAHANFIQRPPKLPTPPTAPAAAAEVPRLPDY